MKVYKNEDVIIGKLNELRKYLYDTWVNNDFDDYTGWEEDWTDLEEAKANLYGDINNLILSIKYVLDEYEAKNATH
jgi:hypothetical protein